MVTYIKSDLDFILAQIKISEDHALYEQTAGAQGKALFGPNGSIPTYNLSWGLRTVDGTYNNLLNPQLGAADNEFPEALGTQFRTILVPAGPGGALVPVSYVPGVDNDGPDLDGLPGGPGSGGPGDVFDPYVRTISNLIVDQTLGNPSAILTGLQRAGIVAPAAQMAVAAQISAAYEPLAPLFKNVSDAERENAEAQAAASANPGNAPLQSAAAATAAALAVAQAALDAVDDGLMTLLATSGIELDGPNVVITNTAPDEGLSAPFNSWFTLFGQFFDHGLDLVAKGGNGTVFVPLMPDDPLYVPGGTTNFMVLTRATLAGPGADGVMGTADDTDRPVNTTTAFVDQNQTYTSHPSHQVFLREYVLNAAGDPVTTGRLIEGGNGGMATWADLKAQAADLLGIQLLDSNVGNVPLLATDQYGKFIPGANGYPQMVTTTGLVEGNPLANGGLGVLVPANVVLTGHAFLADIAHNAVPDGLADGDIEIGLGNGDGSATDGNYDNELLDAHYVAGDGRANENIGLTAVHHVFHSEHNRLMEHTKAVVLATGDAAFIAEWMLPDGSWNGERLFQAAKFGTEMQYQHLVFEEFARKVQPNINVFLVPDGYDVTLDPSIVAEFAHVVYRFGHSMLTETIDRFDPSFNADHIGLIEGFLNPLQFENNGTGATVDANIAAGAIVRGMTRQAGNQIDEFVTSALRNNLLGLPLDLATINLARGRDTGVPSLNAARAQFYEATNEDSLLKPYESWVDFAGHLKNEASIINFVASYGTHALITGQTTIEGKRDAALTLITGVSVGGLAVQADAVDFLNATGAYAGGTLGGLNNVDLWIGGLAEAIMPFGGMLGSTFNFVFEVQMENLQSGDRFYYLQRLDGLHLFGEMENNSFAAMIARNTNASHLPSDVFSTPGLILEVDQSRQYNPDTGIFLPGADGVLGDNPLTVGVDESLDDVMNTNADPIGSGILTQLVIRNNPGTVGPDSNYLRYTGGDHVVLGGTDPGNAANPTGRDILIAGIGDDTLYGDGGNDLLEGGFGNDIINGGDGDDIIKDSGGDDNIKAGAGHDVVHAGPGLDLVMGNDGQDFIFLGTDMGSEVFAGQGNDFIYGNKNAERILGNEGNDWIETGTFDGAPGDNFDEIFAHDGIDGHDVFLGDGGFDEFIGEGGDDIMVGSPGRGKMAGMSGFDWATYKDNTLGVNADLSIPIIFDEAPTLPQNAALDEFESMEGLSGSAFNDVLAGTDDVAADRGPLIPAVPGGTPGTTGYLGSTLDTQGIAMIAGLQAVLGAGVTSYAAGDILLGGDGSDVITGRMGDDIIDGDKWLNVRISVRENVGPDGGTGAELESHTSMTTLAAKMFSGQINPGQLQIVREILTANGAGDVDVAVFSDLRANYAITMNPNGTLTVTHVTVTDGLQSDGSDTLRNIEVLRFSDGDLTLTPPVLALDGFDSAQAIDQFQATTYNNTPLNWSGVWTESSDLTTGNVVTGGQIRIAGTALVFRDDDNDPGNGTATIQRGVNLAGATSATIGYNFTETSFDAGEILTVIFSRDGTALQTVQVIDGTSGTGNPTFTLTGPFTANAFVRFVVSGTNNNSGGGDNVAIDNLTINFVRPAVPVNEDVATSFTEGGAAVSIASLPLITDADSTSIASARVVLTNAELGDELVVVGALPAGITSSIDNTVSGQLILVLTGAASLAAYQAAIQQVAFDNNTDSPTAGVRTINVTVNDGFQDSNIATSSVTVVATNDPPIANEDNIITNFTANNGFVVPEWVMLANDEDPEGDILNVTAATENDGATFAATFNNGAVTATATNTANHDFQYTLNDGTSNSTGNVEIVYDTAGGIDGNGGANILIGNGAASAFNGAGGDDIILAGGGNDTITQTGSTGGRDFVDGEGGEDTYQLNGAAGAETFVIYARAAALAAFPGLVLNEATEIVVTRNAVVIAELDNIEEIRVNTQQVTSPGGTPPGGTGSNGGDTIQVVGNFNAPFTSLNFNTITIDGDAGDDTIDISSLASAHRIVFRSNGGNDTIIGTLRPQDVVELPEGATLDDYDVTEEDGVVTMTSPTHSVSFTPAAGSMPQVAEYGDDDDDEDEDDDYGQGGNDDDDDNEDDDDDDGISQPGAGPIVGTPQDDVLLGTSSGDLVFGFAGTDYIVAGDGADIIRTGSGDDFVEGGSGRDVIFGEDDDDDLFGGNDDDMIYGEAGNDRLFGDGGNDLLSAGAGNDSVFGGVGNDLIVAAAGDGDDLYYGGDVSGDTGTDTLDMGMTTSAAAVDLGTGVGGRGSAVSAQTGTDALWGIDNIVTGSGDDLITASNAVNVIDGGQGEDVFVFGSAASANGDTIRGFETGDKIDLSGIDANGAGAGNAAFTLEADQAATAPAQLVVTHETRADGEYTVISGNTGGDNAPEFKINLSGNHTLTAADFNL